ncbi:MAG TPA: right-handed parallel beta-helix repeat-containing protein [Mucilaginibacter sp.]|jgi:hypothetical protein|nr:right-handed parallel beta-helix repeat-containing protein [Mucilaginibacter sp.]
MLNRFLIFIVASFAILSVSCKKDPGNKNNTASIDTGSNYIGAAPVAAMFADTGRTISFKPSAAINLSNQHDVVIDGVGTSSISLFACQNITIKNCRIAPDKNGNGGIVVQTCTNITIDSCYISDVPTGISARQSQSIVVTHCEAKNMKGPFPAGQFVQFVWVSGGGNRIAFNKFENILGESDPEDAISINNSNGLASDPIMVENNWLRGGGPSSSGGGIMLGDEGGSYQVAKNNILVDPGQYGMAVSCGDHMAIVNNSIYAKSQYFTTEGIYYQNWYPTIPSYNITIEKNAVNFTNSTGQLETLYLGPNNPAPIGWSKNVYNATFNESLLPKEIVSSSIFQ